MGTELVPVVPVSPLIQTNNQIALMVKYMSALEARVREVKSASDIIECTSFVEYESSAASAADNMHCLSSNISESAQAQQNFNNQISEGVKKTDEAAKKTSLLGSGVKSLIGKYTGLNGIKAGIGFFKDSFDASVNSGGDNSAALAAQSQIQMAESTWQGMKAGIGENISGAVFNLFNTINQNLPTIQPILLGISNVALGIVNIMGVIVGVLGQIGGYIAGNWAVISSTVVSVMQFIVTAVVSVAAFIINLVIGLINGIIQLIWSFAEPFLGIQEWILNVANGGFTSFGGAVANLIGQIISWFLSLGKVVTKIIDAIFGTDWSEGLTSLQNNILSWGKNDDSVTEDRKINFFDRVSYTDVIGKSDNVMGNIGNMFDGSYGSENIVKSVSAKGPAADSFGTGISADSLGTNVAATAANTDAIAGSMDKANENLSFLRDSAEREAINHFTTSAVKVEFTSNSTIKGTRDIDGIMTIFRDKLREAVTSGAEEVHAGV